MSPPSQPLSRPEAVRDISPTFFLAPHSRPGEGLIAGHPLSTAPRRSPGCPPPTGVEAKVRGSGAPGDRPLVGRRGRVWRGHLLTDLPPGHVARRILLNYAVYNPAVGYSQGMSDLVAPLLAEVLDEADTFWCFVGLMQNTTFVSSPRDEDMERQLVRLLHAWLRGRWGPRNSQGGPWLGASGEGHRLLPAPLPWMRKGPPRRALSFRGRVLRCGWAAPCGVRHSQGSALRPTGQGSPPPSPQGHQAFPAGPRQRSTPPSRSPGPAHTRQCCMRGAGGGQGWPRHLGVPGTCQVWGWDVLSTPQS